MVKRILVDRKLGEADEKGYTVKEGSIQGATFITSDPGKRKKKKYQEGECKTKDQESNAIRRNR